ncbi:MAG: hypothetical protein B7Z73_12460 [Planctomycetia bacterium 21-64-5]|nr:MAG: hypothetical protein B7Z73_12460 [Planctomycetia bacterium 21-64-5]
MAHVRTFQTGQNSAVSQRILNELSAAKLCLLNPQKRADYDRQLREKTQAAGSAVLPVTAGEGRGEGGGAVLPLPLGDGRGEGGRPRPLPKATPLTADQPAPVVIKSSPSEFSIHKRPRRPPVWQQPAVLAGFAAAAIILPLGIYFLKSGNQEPAASPRKATSVRSSPTVVSGGKHDPKTVPSKPVTTPAPPSVPAASAKPDFEIIDATWGTGDKWVNVTDGVRKQVKNNRLMMMVWSNLFGSPEDPAKGVGKVLRIRYRSRGKQYVADFPDVYFVYLDGNPLAPPTDSPGGLELLEARFGAGLAYADVLPQLREHLRDGRLWVPADEFADTTADELAKDNIHSGTYKVLWIRYRNGTGEHFTYAWNDNPVVIESRLPDAAGPPVDLLKSIDLKRDVVDGEWKLADGVLHAPGTHGTRVPLPLDAPDEYTLTVVAESEPEIMDISVLLPVGGKQVMSVIDGFGGVTSGLQVVNGWRADSNPSYRWRCARMFERARPNTLVYIVRRTSLRVLRDGAEVIRWSGNPAGFSIADGWKVPNHRRIALEAYETPYRVTKLELVPLAPEKSPMLTELEPGKRVDLLKHIDLDRDLLHGHWEYDGQSLVSPDSDKGLFQLPAVVPDSYRLDAVAQREHGNDCLTIMLPIGGKSAALILDGHGGKLSGLQAIDGKNIDANATLSDFQPTRDTTTASTWATGIRATA